MYKCGEYVHIIIKKYINNGSSIKQNSFVHCNLMIGRVHDINSELII